MATWTLAALILIGTSCDIDDDDPQDYYQLEKRTKLVAKEMEKGGNVANLNHSESCEN